MVTRLGNQLPPKLNCALSSVVICADKERVEQIKHVLGIMPAGNFTLTSYLVKVVIIITHFFQFKLLLYSF